MSTWLAAHDEDLIAFRRNLHAHPELSGAEFATTELVAERLTLAGLEPRRLSSGTGLICDIGADDGRGRLAVRADLDGLAMDDRKDVPYRSQVAGVSHACGHDVHTTVALGTALFMAHHPDELPGPMRFIFQPAEERVPGGALDVLADDGLAGVGAVVGVHCEPKLNVGRVGLRSGPISSAADMVTITLTGPGGHTARPELTVDLIQVAANVVRHLPSAVAGQVLSALATDPGVNVGSLTGSTDQPLIKLVFGAINAGDAANVIPSECSLRASLRTPLNEVWDHLPKAFDAALRQVLEESGAGFSVDYVHGVPPVVNDAAVTAAVRRGAAAIFGDDAVVPAVQSWGGDDFAWYTRAVPGTYIRLGTHDPAGAGPRLDLHAGHFDVDERVIGIGVELLVAAAAEHFAPAQ